MWIMNQNGTVVVNSDQIVDIFVNRVGDTIYAETTADRDFIELGRYEKRDICLKILDIYLSLILRDFIYLKMPAAVEAEEWIKEVGGIV